MSGLLRPFLIHDLIPGPGARRAARCARARRGCVRPIVISQLDYPAVVSKSIRSRDGCAGIPAFIAELQNTRAEIAAQTRHCAGGVRGAGGCYAGRRDPDRFVSPTEAQGGLGKRNWPGALLGDSWQGWGVVGLPRIAKIPTFDAWPSLLLAQPSRPIDGLSE